MKRVFPVKMSDALVKAIQPYLPAVHPVVVHTPNRPFKYGDAIIITVKAVQKK